ncbi:MAG: CCA tRNA nucleotidyltransferase [Gemmatimonadales bacterium]|nr:CCA tRNA nucleotidyltransferase [Gemmatimonadales bacterium]
MAEVFPVERIPAEVGKIASRLRDSGFEVWYVGGAVRDVLLELLLGQSAARVGDFDIATSARPEQVQALFRRTVPVGIEHGTVAVLDQSGIAHEVTTFRKDVKTDGRHAEVEFGVTLEDDLARRDFTINAVAVHPWSGEIRDPFGGRDDLRARVVRAVGDPAMRFREDGLRVLRALRFAATLGFALDPATWDALVAAASDLAHLSRERVRDEWLKMLATSLPSVGVGLWRRAGVWREVWPELADFDARAEGTLDEIEPRDPVLLTAAALGYVVGGSDAAEAAVRRLRFSSGDVERVRWVVGGLAEPLPAPGATREVRRWLSRHRASARDVIAVSEPRARRADLLAAVEAVIASGDAIGIRDLAVTGDDLQAAGLAPGKAMGEVLRRLLDEVLDEPWRNTREHLLVRAKELS